MVVKHTGTVKFYNEKDGFGFIEMDCCGMDISISKERVEKANLLSLLPGDKLKFKVKRHSKLNQYSATRLELIK